MTMKPKYALICLTVALVSACGGGGGGSAPVAPGPPVGVDPDPDPDPNAPGTVTLSWIAPALNEDGTTLTGLSGFKIYSGTHPNVFTFAEVTTLDNPGLASFVIENLESGTHYFTITAVDSTNAESEMSNVAGVVIE